MKTYIPIRPDYTLSALPYNTCVLAVHFAMITPSVLDEVWAWGWISHVGEALGVLKKEFILGELAEGLLNVAGGNAKRLQQAIARNNLNILSRSGKINSVSPLRKNKQK